jgi:hypothetical protein
MPDDPVRTEVYDAYWRFAAERMSIFYKRLVDPDGPWTDDPILSRYRFTNAYRATDRVSQYLIRNVQYREDRTQAPDELFFRTILFKLFNKIETWELIERELGTVSWQSTELDRISRVLSEAFRRGARLYNPAYIMPSPGFGFTRKHDNHLALLRKMMDDGLAGRLRISRSLEEAYRLILGYPGLGPFLSFQYAIDLNYSDLLNFEESEYVVAGPGALDGIAKCFVETGMTAAEIIHWMVDRQEAEFARLQLDWRGLYGRRLQPIDCQNLFCEISKYARVGYPHVCGISGRTRIKQQYRRGRVRTVAPYFPPKWGLLMQSTLTRTAEDEQPTLFE